MALLAFGVASAIGLAAIGLADRLGLPAVRQAPGLLSGLGRWRSLPGCGPSHPRCWRASRGWRGWWRRGLPLRWAPRLLVRYAKREPGGEGAALALLALDRECAAVLLHDLACTGQADPAPGEPGDVAPSKEPVEHVGEIPGRDADTPVGNRKRRPLPARVPLAPDRQDDVSTFRAILDCVTNKIV